MAGKSISLTFRLLRSNRKPEDAFTRNFAADGPRKLVRTTWNAIQNSELYVGQIYLNEPDWLTFLKGNIDALSDEFKTGGAGAALFIPIDGTYLVLCFGHIHMTFDEHAFERQFGLHVTLNSVDKTNLRTLDLATPDAVTFQRRVQASKDSNLNAFGVDVLRDLACVAGGTPRNQSFAKFLAGKDSLSIVCKLQPDDLYDKCVEIMSAYKSGNYKIEYKWIDNFKLVQEIDIIEKLDGHLFAALSDVRDGKPSTLHMAPPEILDYMEGDELHYNGFGSHGRSFFALAIDEYAEELNRVEYAGSIAEIKLTHHIGAKIGDSEAFATRWRVYDCFVFDVEIKSGSASQHYILFAGNWYALDTDFRKSVLTYYDGIEKVSLIGPTKCKNERELITWLSNNRTDLVNLDQTKINPNGVKYANLEPCDFLSNDGEFIHLKDGHSSGPISHLWMQGVVSAEAFVMDAKFRKDLKAKVKAHKKGVEKILPDSAKLDRSKYKVVYGIMRKPYRDKTIGIPFFSMLSLQAAAEKIRQLDVKVAIELIEKK